MMCSSDSEAHVVRTLGYAVVKRWRPELLTRGPDSGAGAYFPCLQDFLEWRDPDSNRGHHDFHPRTRVRVRPATSQYVAYLSGNRGFHRAVRPYAFGSVLTSIAAALLPLPPRIHVRRKSSNIILCRSKVALSNLGQTIGIVLTLAAFSNVIANVHRTLTRCLRVIRSRTDYRFVCVVTSYIRVILVVPARRNRTPKRIHRSVWKG